MVLSDFGNFVRNTTFSHGQKLPKLCDSFSPNSNRAPKKETQPRPSIPSVLDSHLFTTELPWPKQKRRFVWELNGAQKCAVCRIEGKNLSAQWPRDAGASLWAIGLHSRAIVFHIFTFRYRGRSGVVAVGKKAVGWRENLQELTKNQGVLSD